MRLYNTRHLFAVILVVEYFFQVLLVFAPDILPGSQHKLNFLLSQLNGTLISNFLLGVFKVHSISSLMYWQQGKRFNFFFFSELELLSEKELLHNILPKFCACHLQLISFLIRSKVCKFSKVCLIIG